MTRKKTRKLRDEELVPFPLRVSRSMVRRIDAQTDYSVEAAEAGTTVTTSQVARRALEIGMTVIEEEQALK